MGTRVEINKESGLSPCKLTYGKLVISPPIVVVPNMPEQIGAARQLAHRLNLPMGVHCPGQTPIELVQTAQRLELRYPALGGPLYVDFIRGALGHRRRRGEGRRQPLARALNLKGGICPKVLDATAGLGRDAFILASLGCRVFLIEQSPIIAALLKDGLGRACQVSEAAAATARMELLQADSITWMAKLNTRDRPEIVYLDPMYPERNQSALSKKEMRFLRALVGKDKNAPLLLQAALACAQHRVVVKRPQLALAVEGPMPSFSIKSKNTRFDIYLPRKEP